MKEIWLIIAIWSGGDGNDWFHFPSPIFENHSICTRYVLENYWDLNSNVNEAYLKNRLKLKTFFSV